MDRFLIRGRKVVSGTHAVAGNKNAALPMIAASLLTSEPVTLTNVPDIADVASMLDAAVTLGARVTRDRAAGTVRLETPRLKSTSLASGLAVKIRTSFLFAGPLLARAGRASLPPPGGDAIGHRRLDTHIAGFRALGAKAVPFRRTYRLSGDLKGTEILLDEASVTATENILMATVLAQGRTELYNAACEPHVTDLARMLNAMGAKIDGVGTNRLVIEGVSRLSGTTARVGCDYIEAGSYLAAAAVTGGELTLTNIDPEPFRVLEGAFARFGVSWTISSHVSRLTPSGSQDSVDAVSHRVTDGGRRPCSDAERLRVYGSDAEYSLHYVPRKRLKMKYDLGDAIPSVSDGPWPAFPSDLLSILIVLATQTRGTCLFFEKMFESRLYFVDQLKQMGAKIVPCDPHRVVVTGPSTLVGETMTSPDIRAGISLVIAALAARGSSVILDAGVVDRGYVAVERELSRLGADIVRESVSGR